MFGIKIVGNLLKKETHFLLLIFCYASSYAQIATTSPYSRYGLGDIQTPGSAQNSSMGGIGIAVQNDSLTPFYNNSANPASYVFNKITTFEAGFITNNIKLQTSSSRASTNAASLAYLSFGLPITNWWGLGFGLMPYSNVGYQVLDKQTVSGIGAVDYSYEGSGGINKFYLGNAIQPLSGLPSHFKKSDKYKRLREQKNFEKIHKIQRRLTNLSSLSIGANVSYVFGVVDNTRRIIFPNTSKTQIYFNTRTTKTTHLNDISFDYGFQYVIKVDSLRKRRLKEGVKFVFGGTAGLASDISAKRDVFSVNYITSGFGYELVKDTIENYTDKSGVISFPLTLGGGMSVKKGERWLVGADYVIQNWSQYSSFGATSPEFKNSMRVSLGGQYTPKKIQESRTAYLKRVQYRLGVNYYTTNLYLKSTQLNGYGVSVGLGLPVGRSKIQQEYSVLNIGVEFGEKGTMNNGLVKEQYTKVVLGFTFNDKWFKKPKYD